MDYLLSQEEFLNEMAISTMAPDDLKLLKGFWSSPRGVALRQTPWYKQMRLIWGKEYYETNKDQILANIKEYYSKPENKVKKTEYNKKYKSTPEYKVKRNIYNKKYYQKNKAEIKPKRDIYNKEYYKNNKESKSIQAKANYQTNKDDRKEHQREYYKNNKEAKKDETNKYQREYYANNKESKSIQRKANYQAKKAKKTNEMIHILTLESYAEIDNYWIKSWEELRELDPGRFTHLKGKLELTEDEITRPDELTSIRKAILLPDVVGAIQQSKKHVDNKKNSPL